MNHTNYFLLFFFSLCFNLHLSAQTTMTLGNAASSDASGDGWNSNMVINETDIYINTSGSTQTIQLDQFNFYARQSADPVTPFVVRVNADNDFTVLEIGTTRTSSDYIIGANSFAFKDGGTTINLNAGETLAIGFLDANADGSGSGSGSVIPYNSNMPIDEIWYTGQSGSSSGSVAVGSAAVPGPGIITTFGRNYHFNIDMTILQGAFAPGGYDQNWANYPAEEFGTVPITFDYTDARGIEQVPAAGVHPRVYISPGEIPDLQNRIQNTASGQAAFKQMHAYTTLLHFSYNPGPYNHNSSYGSDAYGNRYISNAGKWNMNPRYLQLLANDPTVFDNTSSNTPYLLSSMMALEALECMIMAGQTDPDTGLDYNDRAATLAQAMSNWAQMVIGDPTVDWQNYNAFGGVHMALAYDFNYNMMTTNQRDSVRMALAQIVIPTPRYGSETHYYSTTSNWVGLNSFELLTNYAIEGEAGHNPTLEMEYMRSYYNFLTYGWYESGTPYEGLGKNYQFVTSLIAAAKRGYSLLGHPYVRKYGTDFLPAIQQPYGHAMIGTDVWGGTGWNVEIGGYKNNASDIVGLKYVFPNDPKIDFVWRNYIEKHRDLSSYGYVYQHIEPATSGYQNYLVMAVLFAEDYAQGDRASQNEVALGSKSFFAPERGLATLRSSYDSLALMTHLHCRQDMGGHTHGDRNNFTLSALGRNFIRYTYGSGFQETQYHSCILVDDLGVKVNSKDGKKSRQPSKVLNFEDNGALAQMTGDATYAYSWEWDWETRSPTQNHSMLGVNGWSAVTETWNDFRYQPGTESYHNLPFYDFGHWNVPYMLERLVKKAYNPMQRVYRTTALARCARPYMLVIDDVQKDNAIHNYKWLAQTTSDLFVSSTDVNLSDEDYRCDVIMAEPGGNRKLLVRVLNNEGYTGGAPAILETLTPGINGNNPITRLVVEANVVAPDFKIMLYPFVDGDPMPITTWNPTRDELLVNIDGENKIYAFNKTNGLTELELKYSFCTNQLDLTGSDLLVNGTFQVSDWIRSDVPIGDDAIFKAGNCIELNGGFEVNTPNEFDAIIESCSPPTYIVGEEDCPEK